MMTFPKINKELLLIILIIVLGAFLRFYKLDWGDGLFAHPDEYHIVASVSQLSFPNQMHPHFFSYGTATIYLIYFTKQILIFENFNTFLIGRFYSALFSTLTILVVYLLCKRFLSIRFSLFASLLTALTPGLIQQAHFTTPESALTFFLFTSLLFLVDFTQTSHTVPLILSSIFSGMALGVKISSLFFVPMILISVVTKTWRKPLKMIFLVVMAGAITLATLAIIAPYIFLDFKDFRGNLEYEGGLAAGKYPAFYTRQFINTTPFIFQLEKVLPYALGPTFLFTGILGLIFSIFYMIKKIQVKLLLITLTFISLFGFNGMLFAKWTRFIAPTFPFFAIFAAFFLDKLYVRNRSISNILTIALLVTTMLWTNAFFSIYLRPDVRITASNWIERSFPENSTILIEGGNMVDIPLKGNFKRIGFDFYNLEEDAQTRLKIAAGLVEADYFLVQSRRVFMNYQRLPKQFPKTARFYNSLFNGSLGFKQINQFDSYPQRSLPGINLKFPDETAEETWSVFDHPVIRVFQKNVKLNKDEYAKFFE